MRGFAIGLILGVALTAGALFAYFRFGFAPVATSAQPMPMEKYLARAALRSARQKAGNIQPPIEPTDVHLLAGARHYRQSCAECHGLPGIAQTELQKGMYPPPPNLLTGKGVTNDPVGATHWVIQNGVRMTGMPAFDGSYSDEELWEIAFLLSHADQLPPAVQDVLKKPGCVQVESANEARASNSSTANR